MCLYFIELLYLHNTKKQKCVFLQLFTKRFLSSDFKLGRKLIQESVREEIGSRNIVGETFCWCWGECFTNKNFILHFKMKMGSKSIFPSINAVSGRVFELKKIVTSALYFLLCRLIFVQKLHKKIRYILVLSYSFPLLPPSKAVLKNLQQRKFF